MVGSGASIRNTSYEVGARSAAANVNGYTQVDHFTTSFVAREVLVDIIEDLANSTPPVSLARGHVDLEH